jgi:hypothetical protein
MDTFQHLAMSFATVLYLVCLTGFALIFPVALFRSLKEHFKRKKTLS